MNFSEAKFYESYLTWISIQTLYFKTYLPTRQDGFQNRDKVYLFPSLLSAAKYILFYVQFQCTDIAIVCEVNC